MTVSALYKTAQTPAEDVWGSKGLKPDSGRTIIVLFISLSSCSTRRFGGGRSVMSGYLPAISLYHHHQWFIDIKTLNTKQRLEQQVTSATYQQGCNTGPQVSIQDRDTTKGWERFTSKKVIRVIRLGSKAFVHIAALFHSYVHPKGSDCNRTYGIRSRNRTPTITEAGRHLLPTLQINITLTLKKSNPSEYQIQKSTANYSGKYGYFPHSRKKILRVNDLTRPFDGEINTSVFAEPSLDQFWQSNEYWPNNCSINQNCSMLRVMDTRAKFAHRYKQ